MEVDNERTNKVVAFRLVESIRKMNWTYRRPFRQQFNVTQRPSRSNKLIYFRQRKEKEKLFNQPIDAIRLQLADSNYSHHDTNEWKTFDQESSVHSISTVETDFVHQRVSTIHTYPSNDSLPPEAQALAIPSVSLPPPEIDEQQQEDEEETHKQSEQQQMEEEQPTSNQCRSCRMLVDIIDQQTHQIQQYNQQISDQADLLAKLARQYADLEQRFYQYSTH